MAAISSWKFACDVAAGAAPCREDERLEDALERELERELRLKLQAGSAARINPAAKSTAM
jgi:hypothetical protein